MKGKNLGVLYMFTIMFAMAFIMGRVEPTMLVI
jgi:hypothetical protein